MRNRLPLSLSLLLLGAGASSAQPKLNTLKAVVPKQYEVVTVYPTFAESTPVANLAEQRLGARAKKEHNAFIGEIKKFIADPNTMLPSGAGCYQEIKPTVTLYHPARLISVRMDGSQFTGGAHPLPFTNVFTFARVNGTAKQVTLADMFRAGSNYQNRINRVLLAKLKAKKASLVVDGEIKTLKPEQLNRFVVEKDGLRFIFPPYDVASYAEGYFEVKLTPSELGPAFNRTLLAP